MCVVLCSNVLLCFAVVSCVVLYCDVLLCSAEVSAVFYSIVLCSAVLQCCAAASMNSDGCPTRVSFDSLIHGLQETKKTENFFLYEKDATAWYCL